MCDMGGLDNLVANTAYLKAQSLDDKEMRKRRRSLILPQLESCTEVRATIPKDFEDICEQQPIGKTCFRRFLLASSPEYLAAAEFLDDLNDWNLAEAGAKDKARQNIINKFCKADSKSFIAYLTEDMAEKCKVVSEKDFEEVMMGQVKEVCAVQVKHAGHMYACKKLDKKRLKKKGGEKMALLEKKILEMVNSLFLVNLAYAFDTTTHLCMVMTLMNGGDLKYHIYHTGEIGIEMERIIHYTAQIITGILHLHAMDIVYRDLKPENVLLDSQGQCRLSDLGLAVELPNGKTITQKAGTKGYMAPEILKQEPYRTSVDWWALGCSIYEMVAGRLPFRGHKEKVTKEEIVRRTLEDECKFEHKNFDGPSKDIIGLFLKKNVEDRLGCKDDPRKHVFFRSINIPRLEAGLIAPPWVPKPNVVYAKDTGDIRDFSEVKGVEFNANDEKFFKEFSTGAVPIPWQQEMIDSGLFDELNDPNRKKVGLDDDDEQKSKSCTLL
uniref:G protein-coupled receptor kinase n=1 Tax=Sinocyclocheilus anshuiensis TaxID=1608454 RepID=A0A671MJS0_9TELE